MAPICMGIPPLKVPESSVVRQFVTYGGLEQVSIWFHLLVDTMQRSCGDTSAFAYRYASLVVDKLPDDSCRVTVGGVPRPGRLWQIAFISLEGSCRYSRGIGIVGNPNL